MTILAYISFALPAMWAGLALIGFPIAAHLLNRHARTRHFFPTLQLLQLAVAEQARQMKLRRWLLLVLRCVLIAALVAAFAQPVWRKNQAAAIAAGQGNGVVLVMDASASMRVAQSGAPRWEIAQGIADRILADLRGGLDVADIVLADAQPDAVFRELSPNLPALRQELKQYSATWERADAVAAVRLAGQLLRDHRGPKRLVILSDLQRTSWLTIVEQRLSENLPAGTIVTVIDLESPSIDNLALQSPRLSPQQPLAGQVVTLTVELHNLSRKKQQSRVQVQVGSRELAAQTVELQPLQRREVSFESRQDQAGFAEVTFRIDQDGFSADNQCYAVARTVPGIPVGLLSDDDPQRTGSASAYLSLALAPHGDRNDRFAVRHFTSRDLAAATATELAANSAIFVGYLGPLAQPVAERLAEYVRQGGALVVFCGEGPVRRNLQTLDAIVPEGWLPWIPGPRLDLQRRREAARITAGRWRSSLLREFDLASQVALGEIRFGRLWDVVQVRAESEVLLTYDRGLPALATRRFGLGQVVLANFSPAAESSDLGKYGSFVALMQIMAQNLRTADFVANPNWAGLPLTHHVDYVESPVDLQLVDPAGSPLAATVTVQGEGVELHFPAAREPGFYRVRAGGREIDSSAVNLDPAESNLQTLSAEELQTALNQGSISADRLTEARWTQPLDLEGRPLWGWMIVVAMTLAGLEMSLLGWWRR